MSHIIGMGNPLLDISVEVDQSFLDKYKLTCPNAILADETHTSLYKDIVTSPFTPEYVAGGSCQNTVRVAQWMLDIPNSSAYVGSIGIDDAGKILTECLSKDSVKPYYQINESLPTGSCAVLIKDKDRSMVANLAAANAFNSDFLQQNEELKAALHTTKVVAVEGYFLTVVPEGVAQLAKDTASRGQKFAFSLAAPFICQFFTDKLVKVLENTDIVFANEHEAEALAKTLGWEDITPLGVAKKLSTFGRDRVAVITCGPEDIIVGVNGETTSYPVPKLSSEQIVDANGAGDAFMGGYLAGYILNKSTNDCIRAGIYASQYILGTHGTKLSGKPDFTF